MRLQRRRPKLSVPPKLRAALLLAEMAQDRMVARA